MMARKTNSFFSQLLDISKKSANSKYISVWKRKGLYNESIKPPVASNHCLALALNYINA